MQQTTFAPSIFQKAIFEEVKNGTSHLIIDAVAGSGKTTTIVQCLDLIDPSKVIYFLAFNKAIVEELRDRVPSYVNVSTLHSIGHQGLMKAYKSKVDDKIIYGIVDTLRSGWYAEQGDLIDADYLSRVRKLVDLFRVNLCTNANDLREVAHDYGVEILNGEIEKAIHIMQLKNAYVDSHDFVDMLYKAAIDPAVKLPTADFIFVDECQDLNKAQQALVRKMMKEGTRVIFVGDPRQAIYGFAGADADSFERLKGWDNMKQLPLSFNYRCGSDIIDYVRNEVEGLSILAHEGAPKGSINERDSIKNIQPGDMVLCRNTAPLVKMCLEFIKGRTKAYVKGGEIGKQLVGMVARSKAKTITDFELWLDRELKIVYSRLAKTYPSMLTNELKQEPAYSVLSEKIEVFKSIIDSGEVGTPQQLIMFINEIFADHKAGICFSTIHKSKGLENNRVFIIERQLMPSIMAKTAKAQQQEQNLIYVAFTRAKNHLGFVSDWSYKNQRL